MNYKLKHKIPIYISNSENLRCNFLRKQSNLWHSPLLHSLTAHTVARGPIRPPYDDDILQIL
jgi:hypothetical protein